MYSDKDVLNQILSSLCLLYWPGVEGCRPIQQTDDINYRYTVERGFFIERTNKILDQYKMQ